MTLRQFGIGMFLFGTFMIAFGMARQGQGDLVADAPKEVITDADQAQSVQAPIRVILPSPYKAR